MTVQTNSCQTIPSQLSPRMASPSRLALPCPCHIANGNPTRATTATTVPATVTAAGHCGANTRRHQGKPCKSRSTATRTGRKTPRRGRITRSSQ